MLVRHNGRSARYGVCLLALALFTLGNTMMAQADPILLHAAGSLRGALTDVIKSYEMTSGQKVQAKFGASGTLKDEIAGGAKAEVFASANMEHPQALSAAGKSGPVLMFARNRLCALVRSGLTVTPENLLERMLDPAVKLGTSTPKADPSGDYAFEVFTKTEALHPGARAILEKKALQLTGSASSAAPPAGRGVYEWHVAEGHADIYLTYCTNAMAARKDNPGQQIVDLPAALSVGAEYGLTIMNGATPDASRFAAYILSPDGQAVLVRHGFAAPN
jgi:molybdenum ABC transporter molybdate-binding protein